VPPVSATWYDNFVLAAHIATLTSRIRLIFNWAVAEEIVPVQVADALKHVRGLRRGEQDVRESEAVTPVPQAETDWRG